MFSREKETKKGHDLLVSLMLPDGLLYTNLAKCGFDLLLECAEGFCAIDAICLGYTIYGIGNQKAWRAGDACGLPILEIFLDTVFIFAAAITTVELSLVQPVDFLGYEWDAF